MNYQQKYLKYKNKYITLRNQIGGDRSSILLETLRETNRLYPDGNVPKSHLNGNIFLEKLATINPFNKDTSIYVMLGHGCDLDRSEEVVPQDCMYVHEVECGLESYDQWYNLRCLFSYRNKILKDPIKNKSKLEEIGIKFTFDRQYDTYVNNRFSPYLISNYGFFSGLHQIGQPISREVINEDGGEINCIIYSIKDEKNEKDEDKFRNDSPDEALCFYHELYRHSLFPTKQDVIEVTKYEKLIECFKEIYEREGLTRIEKIIATADHFEKLMIKYFRVDIKTLFKYFPGIYYSISCRSPCEDKDPEDTFFKERRMKSKRDLNFPPLLSPKQPNKN
jgi:hypothetical protein